jgi:hypothetical protein
MLIPTDTPFLTQKERICRESHITETAHANLAEWRQESTHWQAACGDIGKRWFEAPPIRSEMDCWAALHELGHIALELPTYDHDGVTVLFENEVRAWEWALEQAIAPPSATASGLILLQLHTHIEDGQPPPKALVERLDTALGEPHQSLGLSRSNSATSLR